MDVPGGDMLQKNAEAQAQINTNVQQNKNEFQNPVDFTQIEKEKYENRFEKKTEKELLNRNVEIRANRTLVTNVTNRVRLKESAEELKNASQILVQDKKWYEFFQAESAEMTRVKNSLNYLNNIMEQNIFSMDKALLKETVNQAYITVLAACDTYVSTHQDKARHSVGQRRMARVKQIRSMAQKEKDRFMIAANNYVMGMLSTAGMKTVRDLSSGMVLQKAKVSRFMTQGNSSNVYRQLLMPQEEETVKQPIPENETAQERRLREMAERDEAERKEILKHHVYVKKDEPLINEDLPGYLDRRIKELTRSRNNKAAFGDLSREGYLGKVKEQEAEINELDQKVAAGEMTEEEATAKINEIRAKQEELRLVGRLDDKDYELAQKFLTTMKNKLTGGDKKEKEKRLINFLGHDFDRVFENLKYYNLAVEQATKDEESLKKTIEALETHRQKDPNIDAMIKKLQEGQSEGTLEKKTGYQWISEHAKELGLDPQQDQDVLDVLKELQQVDGEQAFGSERVSRLFKRSLGKEAELFGQQCERSGLTDTQALASNNTATARIAKLCGFQDVVTRSWKAMLTFQEIGQKGEETTTAMCTLSEEAEGEEMLELVAQAEKQGASLHYSPNAVRQLMRLQMFDTLCLQTDRHWRNFKCKVTKDDTTNPPQWTIKSLKSYDHDQSFGPKSLGQYFTDIINENGQKCTNRPGFLPPLMMTVDKKSKLYSYLKATKIGGYNDRVLDSIHRPAPKGDMIKVSEKKRRNDGKDLYENSDTVMYIPEWIHSRIKGNAWGCDWPNYGTALESQTDSTEFFKEIEELEKLLVHKPENGGFQFRSPSEFHKTNAEKKEAGDDVASITEILDHLKKLKLLYQKLDLSEADQLATLTAYGLGGIQANTKGLLDYMIQGFMHQIKLIYGNEPEALAELEQMDKEAEKQRLREKAQKIAKEQNQDRKKVEKQLEEEQNSDTIQVPTLLHMDKEAYEGIKGICDDWETVEMTLRDLGWSDEKREALKTRAREIVEQAKQAERTVNEWADQMGYKQDDIRRKFFLDEEDYDKIESITDIASDPSMSYFSIEDPNFLADVTQYKNLMTETDRQNVIDKTNEMRASERQSLEQLKDNYHQMVSGKIMKSEDSAMMKAPGAELKQEQQSA